MNTRSEALRLADELDGIPLTDFTEALADDAAAELRRLHALNAELLEVLKNLYTVTYHLGACPGTVEEARAAIAKATGSAA